MKKEVNIFQKIISSIIVLLGIVLILFVNNNITGRVISTGQDTPINLTEIVVIAWSFLMIIIGIWIGITKKGFNSIIPPQ